MLAVVPGVAAEELYAVVVSPTSTNEEKLRLIMSLKSHVKRDFVDISQVPKYLEALSIAIDIPDIEILANSFSVLCHLVKRVSIQDSTSRVLKEQSYLVLPIIINKLGDVKSSSRSSAKKALEAYWLSASKKVELGLSEIGFSHRNPRVVHESITWLNHIIVNINPHFKLDSFVPSLVAVLLTHKDSDAIVEAVKELFKNYYNMKHNRLHKFELQKELDGQNIPNTIKLAILNAMDLSSSSQLSVQKRLLQHLPSYASPTISSSQADVHAPSYASSTISAASKAGSPSHSEKRKSTIRVRSSPSLRRQEPRVESRTASDTRPKPPASRVQVPIPTTKSIPSEIDGGNDLNKIIFKIPNYPLDTSIVPIDCHSADDLYKRVNELQPAFDGKETEFNWGVREKNIIVLRSLLRGNSPDDYVEELISSIKDISEGVCKAITSLRTTLSSHGCQLIKEMAVILKTAFDPLVDLFLPTLIKLCSATKNIASSNANMAICTIFLNISFSSRWFSKILLASTEKNTSPRTYSGLWLQISLIRFHDSGSFLSPHGSNGTTGVDVSKRIISKLIGDPNPAVRQVAKEAYWCFWSKFRTEADLILSTFDANTVKGIERTRPKEFGTTTLTSLNPKKSRPSIKDVIIAKNKEMKSRQRESSAEFRPPSRVTSRSSSDSLEREVNRRPSKTYTDHLKLNSRVISGLSNRISSTSLRSEPVPAPHPQPASDEMEIVSHSPQVPAPVEQPVSNPALFDKQKDPILKFLSSSKVELIEEGIHLLRYAIIGDEDLSTEANRLLTTISIDNPTLLQPLFLEGDNLFKKSSKFFEAEHLIRICSIILPINEKNVLILISLLSVDEVFESTTKVLSYVSNLSNIIDDGQLVMQVIKYKKIIVSNIIDFLLICTDKIPINDSQYLKLISVLFDLVDILRSTQAITSFTVLLKKLYAINPGLFTSELQMLPDGTREDIESIIGIEKSTAFTMGIHNQLGSAGDLTKVVPIEDINVSISPLKAPSDFTMLVPARRDGPDSTIILKKNINTNRSVSSKDMDIDEVDINAEPQFDKVVEDNIDIEEEIETKSHDPTNDQLAEEPEPITSSKDVPMDVPGITNNDRSLHVDSIVDLQGGTIAFPDGDEINLDQYFEPSINNELGNQEIVNDNNLDDDNIFKSEVSSTKNDLFARFNQSDSAELVDDFAQVKITELIPNLNPKESVISLVNANSPKGLNLNDENSIQSFIDKVDPINKISNKNKPISIFQDGSPIAGSPQKLKDYSYSEFNWFNFQIAKSTNTAEVLAEDLESSIEKFDSICTKLQSNTIEKPQFLSLLHFLQGTQTNEFRTYFESKGQALLETSIWAFFGTREPLPQSLKLSGLLILKQLLINRVPIDLEKLWHVLIQISSSNSETMNELSLAISETYEEAHYGIYPSTNLVQLCLKTLKSPKELNEKSCLFVIECLSKLLGMNSFNLLVDDSLIVQIDEVLETLIDHKEVEIRRFVILSYGKLLKASRVTNLSCNNGNNLVSEKSQEKNVFDSILQKFSLPQQKLVEYYSQD